MVHGFCIYSFFLITVSIYSTVLNNTLNFSPDFDIVKVIFPNKLFNRFLYAYGTILNIKFVHVSSRLGVGIAIGSLIANLWSSSLIMAVMFMRLSCFRLIKERWKNITFELPFHYATEYSDVRLRSRLVVKGDPEIESEVGSSFYSEFTLCLVTYRNSCFEEERSAVLTEKLFLFNDDIFYRLTVYKHTDKTEQENYIRKVKNRGMNHFNKQYPIVAVLELKNREEGMLENTQLDGFLFVEWCYKNHLC